MGVGSALPPRLVVTVIVLGAAAVAVYGGASRPALPAAPPPPPAFGDVVNLAGSPCAEPLEGARVRQAVAELAGTTTMARYPFIPEEGMRGARLLREASACARAAGDTVAVARLDAAAARWAARLSADYRSRVVRVEIALEREPRETALAEVRALRRLLGPAAGAYVSWLDHEALRLERGEKSE